ncbi:MAG: DNA mismatch repair endonuclease MutL [Muribaculaceae bacterium]|nr:DNA mismatch repair endonuclease MutL [Muribaculaceae bacterium]
MNSDVIRLLPDSVANQIAAGEVIQRPASVIKELVENSIDSGASEISVILKDAGRTLIQVVDNGCGMSPTDARMAFERHATSKIASAADLYSLHTMGFRGEALPSIAAVAQIDLRTMRRGDDVGTRLLISESKYEGQEPATCVPGTNLMVKNLFFHMPARRKFLKKDSVELSHILREFERLALVNTGVAFTLIHNDVTLHQFGAGTLKQRISALFGKNLAGQLASVCTETSLVKIEGFVGLPRFAKKRGAQQFFFVNGRNMRHPFFHKAIMRCYEHLVSADSQPSYFINFEVDPSTIDVNIHPQKHEIKFEHEQAIWQILEAAVRETLGKSQAAGALDFEPDDVPEIPLFDPSAAASAPAEDFDSGYNPFRAASDNVKPASSAQWQSPARRAPEDWEKLYENFSRKRDDAFGSPASDIHMADEELVMPSAPGSEDVTVAGNAAAASCFQLGNAYIVTSSHRGIMVISQRRAHIRILFERYMSAFADGAVSSQTLLFAEDFEVASNLGSVLEAIEPSLATFGFGLRRTSLTAWSINAVPSMLTGVSPVEVVLSLAEDASHGQSLGVDTLREPLALSMARSAAVGSAQPLTATEMENIVADLFRCAEPSFTPDGLPVMTIIDNEELSNRF